MCFFYANIKTWAKQHQNLKGSILAKLWNVEHGDMNGHGDRIWPYVNLHIYVLFD